MTFNSLTFALFFLAVLGLYRLPLGWSARKAILLGASYVFYAAWNPPFVALLLLSTGVDWTAARGIHRSEGRRRRAWLLLSLGTNLGLLAFFKYAGFAVESFAQAARLVGIDFEPAAADIVLPMGISFYTFQTLSYTIDIYRRRLEPSRSLLDYALYVTFFPQLVAGPIVRAIDFLPQCTDTKRLRAEQLGFGFALITIGLFQKTILADAVFAPLSDQVFDHPRHASFATAWIGTLAFSGQIFCDFAGYSSCGIGVALCLGFRLPDNFRCPYAAVGFRDFWRRWHISLSSWLRDYVYIPLGGNRGSWFAQYRSLMVTMLLGGLWHGASWTFVIWGGLHGCYLVAERIATQALGGSSAWRRPLVRAGLAVLTLGLVCVAWVFFRAHSFSAAVALIRAMFGADAGSSAAPSSSQLLALPVFAALVAVHVWMRHHTLREILDRLPRPLVALLLATLLFTMAITHEPTRGFLYFQF